jgi:large subunit ribosomal protein L3
MEFIVEKIGMSRTLGAQSVPVTLVRVLSGKVCELKDNRGVVAYSKGKKANKPTIGQQKKYELSEQYNKFATLDVANKEVGELDLSGLESAKEVKVTFNTKGRGFTGVMKRWNFQGGPGGHGSRFHRAGGSIGNREWPGRVQKGKKMAGQYGNETVTAHNEIVSFDKENNILALKGSVPGYSGAFGRVRIVK